MKKKRRPVLDSKNKGTSPDRVKPRDQVETRAKSYLIGFSVLAFFVYLPAFMTTFGIHNDYCFITSRLAGGWLSYPESMHLLALGRPLGAILLNIQGYFLGSLASFTYGRLVSFAVSMGVGWLVFRYLTDRLKVDAVFAGAISFCLVLVPGCQLCILLLGTFTSGIVNIGFGLLLYSTLDKVEPVELLRGRGRAFGLALLALGLFFLSLCIYPPTALTFLALTFANILFAPMKQWPDVRLRVARDLVFAGAGLIFYYLITKFVMLPLFAAYGTVDYKLALEDIEKVGIYRFQLTTDLADKFSEFVNITAIAIGGMLHAIIGDSSGWIVGGLIMAAFAFAAFHARRTPGVWRTGWIAQRLGLGVLVILCSSAPLLAAAKGQVGYRIVTTYEFIAILCLFAPLHWLSRLWTNFPIRTWALGVALLMGGLAGWNVSDVARNGSRELQFIREKLVAVNKDRIETIIGVLPSHCAWYIDQPLQLEFAYPIEHIAHLAGAVEALMPEAGLDDRPLRMFNVQKLHEATYSSAAALTSSRPPIILLSPGESGGTMVQDENTVLIDLNKEVVAGGLALPPIPIMRTSNGEGGRVLLDPFFAGDWQPGPAPQWMEINAGTPVPFSRLLVGAGPSPEEAAAMPRDWQVYLSDNEKDWVQVDSRTKQDNWKPGEVRKFAFSRTIKAKYVKIIFSAGNSGDLQVFKLAF